MPLAVTRTVEAPASLAADGGIRAQVDRRDIAVPSGPILGVTQHGDDPVPELGLTLQQVHEHFGFVVGSQDADALAERPTRPAHPEPAGISEPKPGENHEDAGRAEDDNRRSRSHVGGLVQPDRRDGTQNKRTSQAADLERAHRPYPSPVQLMQGEDQDGEKRKRSGRQESPAESRSPRMVMDHHEDHDPGEHPTNDVEADEPGPEPAQTSVGLSGRIAIVELRRLGRRRARFSAQGANIDHSHVSGQREPKRRGCPAVRASRLPMIFRHHCQTSRTTWLSSEKRPLIPIDWAWRQRRRVRDSEKTPLEADALGHRKPSHSLQGPSAGWPDAADRHGQGLADISIAERRVHAEQTEEDLRSHRKVFDQLVRRPASAREQPRRSLGRRRA